MEVTVHMVMETAMVVTEIVLMDMVADILPDIILIALHLSTIHILIRLRAMVQRMMRITDQGMAAQEQQEILLVAASQNLTIWVLDPITILNQQEAVATAQPQMFMMFPVPIQGVVIKM